MKKDLVAFQLVKFLEARGVEKIFGLCGHTVIGFLDALKESAIHFVSVRHEQIAAHAATAIPGERDAVFPAFSSPTSAPASPTPPRVWRRPP